MAKTKKEMNDISNNDGKKQALDLAIAQFLNNLAMVQL